MFWMKKQEIALEESGKKIVLERVTLFGGRRRIKFIEHTLPSTSHSVGGKVISLTCRRRGWRFRLANPIQTIYYKYTEKGQWVKIGSVLP